MAIGFLFVILLYKLSSLFFELFSVTTYRNSTFPFSLRYFQASFLSYSLLHVIYVEDCYVECFYFQASFLSYSLLHDPFVVRSNCRFRFQASFLSYSLLLIRWERANELLAVQHFQASFLSYSLLLRRILLLLCCLFRFQASFLSYSLLQIYKAPFLIEVDSCFQASFLSYSLLLCVVLGADLKWFISFKPLFWVILCYKHSEIC